MVSGTCAATPSTGMAPPAGKRPSARRARNSRSLLVSVAISAAGEHETVPALVVGAQPARCPDHLLAFEDLEGRPVGLEEREGPPVVLEARDDDRVPGGALAVVQHAVGLDARRSGRAR